MATSTPVVQRLPCDKIVISPFQPRLDAKNANIPEIGASIKEDGAKKPILCRPIYKRPGDPRSGIVGYELVDGERRWRGTQWAGIKWIPGIVEDMDDAKARRLALVLNIQSENLTDYEIALALRAQLNPEDGSEPLSIQELCRLINKSRTYADNHLKLLEVREDLKELAQVPGKLSITLLLNDIKSPVIFDELYDLALEGAPFQILKILSVVTDNEARSEIRELWEKGAVLKKLEEKRDKAVKAAKASAQLLTDSTTPPDQETSSRSNENARSGGGNVSRGRPVTGLSISQGNQGLHQTVKELWWKMENAEKWAPAASPAKRKKEAEKLDQMAEFLTAISKQWKSGEKPVKISTPYPEE